MANVNNTRKKFGFSIEIDGFNQFVCQKVTRPEVTIDQVTHADTNYDIKTPGRYKVSDMVLENISSTVGTDLWAEQWLLSAQNPVTGGGLNALDVKKTIRIHELDNTGTVVLRTDTYIGCWVCGVDPGELDRAASENIARKVTIAVDLVQPK